MDLPKYNNIYPSVPIEESENSPPQATPASTFNVPYVYFVCFIKIF